MIFRARRQIFVLGAFTCLFYLIVYFQFYPTKLCSCSSCVKEAMEDVWFLERYNTQVPIMMNRKNSQLSNVTKHWWLNLQRRDNKENYSEVIESLFSVFPDVEHYKDDSPERCRTCAVVGNSANLLRSHYGPLIDIHDFVIRMNMGPTKNFTKDVGKRTTHRAMYPESAVEVDNSTHIVFLPFKIMDLQWLIKPFTTKHIRRLNSKVQLTISTAKDKVKILNPEFMRYVRDSWVNKQGLQPSTGFLMIILALHICDQVSVFGFGPSKDGNWGHYFNQFYKINLDKGAHRGTIEQNNIWKLAKKNKLQLYNGR